MDDICENDLPPRYSFESCLRIATRYSSKPDWKAASAASYNVANDNGWLSDCCIHMGEKGLSKDEALKFKSKILFNNSAIDFFSGNHVPKLTNRINRKHSLLSCKESARRFNKPSDWYKSDQLSYATACTRGWLVICCEHMVPVNKKPKAKAS